MVNFNLYFNYLFIKGKYYDLSKRITEVRYVI